MKAKLLFVFVILLLGKVSFGDVIMPNTHYVSKCVKITNLGDYPDVAFIGYSFSGDLGLSVTMLSSDECLNKGYKYNEFDVYAINKSYLTGKDISKINFRHEPNALPSNIAIEPYQGFMYDSIPISGIEEYYKVVGFSDSKAILYLWKKVTKYNNGKLNLIENFTYDGEVSQLYQKIKVGINSSKKPSAFEVFPNPANKNIHLRIVDNYVGPVAVELVNSTGKVVKSISLNKKTSILEHDIPVNNVTKGAYLVKVQMGKIVDNKKVLIR